MLGYSLFSHGLLCSALSIFTQEMKPTKPKPTQEALNNQAPAPAPQDLYGERSVNELRAMFPLADDYEVADLMLALLAYSAPMETIRHYKRSDFKIVLGLVRGRALGMMHEVVSSIPRNDLPHNSADLGAGGAD